MEQVDFGMSSIVEESRDINSGKETVLWSQLIESDDSGLWLIGCPIETFNKQCPWFLFDGQPIYL